MKLHILVGGLLLLGSTRAQPHHHLKHPIERDLGVVEEIVEVVWEVVTATSLSTMTVWLSGDATVAPSPPASSGEGGQFYQPGPSFSTRFLTSSIAAAPAASPASTYVAPPAVSNPVAVAPTSVAAAPVAVPTTTTPAAVAVTPLAAAPAPAPALGYSGVCSASSPCTGDITYYDAGLGACGITSDSSQMVIALPHDLMGTQSNGNPYCGQTVTITANQRNVVVTVVDKCMGCAGYSIDLSNAAFLALGFDLSVGRTTASWYFN